MQWLDIRLQLIGVAVVSSLGAIAVIQQQYGSVDPGESSSRGLGDVFPASVSGLKSAVCLCLPDPPPSGLVGLSLSYALSITVLLSGLIFSFTQTEMQLVSVERTEEYSTGLPSEPQDQNTQV